MKEKYDHRLLLKHLPSDLRVFLEHIQVYMIEKYFTYIHIHNVRVINFFCTFCHRSLVIFMIHDKFYFCNNKIFINIFI